MGTTLRILLSLALLQATSAQRNATASVEGIVVEQASGRPVAEAIVELTGIASGTSDWKVQSFSTLTAGDGSFRINGVPPGDAYQVVVTHSPDFAPAAHGQSRSGDVWVPFALTAGQRRTGLRFALVSLSSISGLILDKDGKAVRGMGVFALEVGYRDGQRILHGGRRTSTDEHGEYRIAGLSPGRYVVRMGPVKRPVTSLRNLPADPAVVPYTYFPNAADPDSAATFEVGVGAKIDFVDFVSVQIPTRHVRGVVTSAVGGLRIRDARVFLLPPGISPDSSLARELTSKEGEFDFGGVAPGEYQVFAIGRQSGVPLSGRIPVTVANEDLRGVTLPLRADFEVLGRVAFHDPVQGKALDLSGASLSLHAVSRGTVDLDLYSGLMADSRTEMAVPRLQSDATFGLRGVQSWPYAAEARLRGTYVKSIRQGARDLLSGGAGVDLTAAEPVEVVFGTDGGVLDGRVINEDSIGMAHSVVVLVPDAALQARRDLYRTAQTDGAGRFHVEAIAPGSYKVFAWRGADTGAWFFPEFLKPREGQAVPVFIAPFDRKQVEAPLLPTTP